MIWKMEIRQMHRWISMAFTLGVIANIIAIANLEGQEQPASWIYALALIPLALLLLTGLYLFILPYAAGRRSARRATGQEGRS